ncbi:MAG: DUF952 domain-containing protein [Pegethrix bostrychoides GSE-TBD4-15B]|jgi:uncharacterized protein (DUF952 family)|uniref:DUF952 domain-containing protein n=1 Tax=Pegethrix bostrychoides GSE-TBD4-15B TaxID=2839662 RepID=A0A951PCD4_9CYAN|nr:DUF952 domain-containing protein [Pegethrix bostrychoides GSE-TBD4-15B]
MDAIFHIAERDQWQAIQTEDIYQPASLEIEGFIHCSTMTQVTWVADKFFRGQSGLVLLKIDPERLWAELRFDPVEGLGLFPHLYGALNLDAVVQVVDFPPQPNGRFTLPEGFAS